jgi:hypothetical protein
MKPTSFPKGSTAYSIFALMNLSQRTGKSLSISNQNLL